MSSNIKPHIKRGILVIFIIFVSLLQFTGGALQSFFGVGILYLIPAVICISMFQGEIVSMCCGLLAGLIWDLVSAQSTCFHAVFLTVTAFLVSFIIQRRVRNFLISSLILNGAALFLHNILYWIFYVLSRKASGSFIALIKFYMPSFLITLAVSIPVYFIVRAIHNGFRKMA